MRLAGRRRSWWLAAAAGVGVPRPWLLEIELTWFALVIVYRAAGPVGGSAGSRTEFFLLTVVSAVCVLATMSRWWKPQWLVPVALAVFVVGALVVLVRPPGPLGVLRLTMSLALIPILLTATVRRAEPRLAAAVVVVAVVAAAIDVRFYGNTLSVELARTLLGSYLPERRVVLLAAALTVVLPVALGLLLRTGDAGRRTVAVARRRAEERRQVARELHDMVANHVTGMLITAQTAAMIPALPSTTTTSLHTIEEEGNRALDAMQRMVTALRSADGIDLASAAALPPLGETMPSTTAYAAVQQAVGTDGEVRVHGGGRREELGDRASTTLSPEIATTVHRVVTEALTNARRHRPSGTWIDVELDDRRPDRLIVQVTNQRGRARVGGGGFGLVGLAERVSAVGGRLDAGPVEGDRWQVRAELPHSLPRSEPVRGDA